jgi:hypothetical protein
VGFNQNGAALKNDKKIYSGKPVYHYSLHLKRTVPPVGYFD